MTAAEAITSRRSIRAFLPTPVPRADVELILDIAARAPSGTNMQPWRGYALAGARLRALTDGLVAEAGAKVDAEYRYYPEAFFEPYLSRRRKVGWDLYGLLGIAKGDTDRMKAQHARNFTFFGAPVGMIFTIDRRLEIGSWLDYGMFLGNVMTVARGMGLDTCPQAAFAPHHATIRAMLDIPEHEVVVCGMALGHADPSAPENTLVTERATAAEFCAFLGWDDR
ncbi:nitroreductase [Roseomonas fluvialis]|uniref:Nitroreductase n=1 Tax=Roseomonas fluvialis TaxID=1750527 RepID=A0ABN6P5W1_9PROT|nr:nitroreductase [Roseomonas fluvialis]BDG73856.1 nitroreductase [Roseomonas fluvialis]